MNPYRCCFIVMLLLLSACGSRQPFSTAREINEQCMLEMETARTAVRLREKGKTLEEMKSTLPPMNSQSSRLLVYMHEIIEEVYQYSNLNEIIYPTYRFEFCSRNLTGKPVPTDISTVYPVLLACQDRFGERASAEGTNCIITGLENITHRGK